MANVFYLDVDDEITSAAARIRSSEDPRVGLVLPPGSRIATSRINFRLLAREALERNRALSIISPDPAARALAGSAGLPVFATVGDYQAEQDLAPQPGGGGSNRAGRAAGTTASTTESAGLAEQSWPEPGPGLGASGRDRVAGGSPGPRSGAAAAPVVRAAGKRSPGSARMAASVLALVVILLVLGLIGAFFLPSASITITPGLEAVGPLQLSIRADPTASSPDPVAGVVPAVQLRKDFAAVNTFKATGKKTNTTPATGMVTFTSINTVTSVSFPAGSIVSTTSGVAFTTTEALTIPRARFGHTAPSGSVAVQAVKGGTAGNVAADSINQLPAGYASYLYTVNNPAATTGGTATTTLQVQKSDTDAAVASLTKTLKQQFSTWLNQPDGLPAGNTAYPRTGALSAPTADTDPGTLVGVVEASFELTLTATGTETAVDPATVSSLALGRIQAQVSPEFSLVTGSERVTLGPAQADGQTLIFPVTASASQVRHLDPDTLRQQVAGKSIDEARSILSGYGSVDIQTWPGFVGSIPSLAWRLSLTIDTSAAAASPGASSPPAAASIVPGSSPSAGPSGPPSSGASAVPSSGPAGQSANP